MKKRLAALILLLTMMMVSACGLSEENQIRVSSAQDELKQSKKKVEDLYGRLSDDYYAEVIENLEKKYSAYDVIDTQKLRNKEVDALVQEMGKVTASYKELEKEMGDKVKFDEEVIAEAAKYKEILCFIQNDYGSEITGIVLKDKSQRTESDNLLVKGQSLGAGQVLSGVVLTVYEDSTSWDLIITDILGNQSTYDVDFPDEMDTMVEEGISIIIHTPETGLSIGKY
jgi:hypothetical protein